MKLSLTPLSSIISTVALSVLSTVSIWTAELDDKVTAFSKLANGVIHQTVVGTLDVPAVSKDLDAMENLATWFAAQYKTKFPSGGKLIDFMLAKKDSLSQMSLADIDAQFEAEAINKAHGKDLGLDLTNEDEEHFGNVVDLFVHPATAHICAILWSKNHQTDELKRIQSELQEVIEHCHKVADKLK